MNKSAHRGIQRTDHQALTKVNPDVGPVAGAIRVLHHNVARLRVVGLNHWHPLFSAWQRHACLGVSPLDESGTVPTMRKARPSPDVGMTQPLIRRCEDILADLGDQLGREFRDLATHGIDATR